MKKQLFAAGILWAFCLSLYAFENTIRTAEDITYDLLVKLGDETGSFDHISHFRQIFKKMKVKTFLEFGVSYGTKYFLDMSNKVISVEFITHGYGPDTLKYFLNLFQEYSNWIPLSFFSGFLGDVSFAPYKYLGSEAVYKAASYQTVTHKNYALIDSFYLTELDAFIRNLIRFHKIDIAFVDSSGVYLRGDLVQLLFDKVKLIVAHDTGCKAQKEVGDVYGYSRVQTPDNYEEIHFPVGQGTTVWVMKDSEHQEKIDELKRYAKRI